MQHKIREILDFLAEKQMDAVFQGDENDYFEGFSSLRNYKENSITWVRDKKILNDLHGHNTEDYKDVKLAVIQMGVDFFAQNQIISKESKLVFFFDIEQVLWR